MGTHVAQGTGSLAPNGSSNTATYSLHLWLQLSWQGWQAGITELWSPWSPPWPRGPVTHWWPEQQVRGQLGPWVGRLSCPKHQLLPKLPGQRGKVGQGWGRCGVSAGGHRCQPGLRPGPRLSSSESHSQHAQRFCLQIFPPSCILGWFKICWKRKLRKSTRFLAWLQGSPLCGRQLRLEPALQGSHLSHYRENNAPGTAACEGPFEDQKPPGGGAIK